MDPSSCGKAPLVESNPLAIVNPTVFPSSDTSLSEAPYFPNLKSSKAPPLSASYTLLRSEALAWDRFKTVVNEDDVIACYDMYIKEFECSTIHDLFKVLTSIHSKL